MIIIFLDDTLSCLSLPSLLTATLHPLSVFAVCQWKQTTCHGPIDMCQCQLLLLHSLRYKIVFAIIYRFDCLVPRDTVRVNLICIKLVVAYSTTSFVQRVQILIVRGLIQMTLLLNKISLLAFLTQSQFLACSVPLYKFALELGRYQYNILGYLK
jgi:hypothetical protein